jgi:hypothetical protein
VPEPYARRVIELRSDHLAARIDDARGGEILSLLHIASATELLYQAPWEPPATPLRHPATEADWVGAWPGGWTLLAPNSGNACTLEGRAHGYHGAASLDAWRADRIDDASVALHWRDVDGALAIRRDIALDGASLTVQTVVANTGAAPARLAPVEHLVLGAPLVGPGMRVAAEAQSLVVLTDAGPPLGDPADALAWPRDETGTDWSVAAQPGLAHFGCLHGVTPSLSVTNDAVPVGVRVGWSAGALPYLWFWHEHERAGWPGDSQATCLGIEPASVPTGEGLAHAVETGTAVELRPDGEVQWQVRLDVTGA